MKKLTLLIVLTCLIGFINVFTSQAQSDKKFNKALDKAYQTKRKDLKKEGWKISVSDYTLDIALMKHYRKLNSDANNKPFIVEVTLCNSLNVCKNMAFNNAAIEYANLASTYVRGRIASDISGNASTKELNEFDKFYAAYERYVSIEIKGELQYSLSIEKPNGDGRSFQSWYIVNQKSAAEDRLRAMKRAYEETLTAQKYAEQVSKFVSEGFELNDKIDE